MRQRARNPVNGRDLTALDRGRRDTAMHAEYLPPTHQQLVATHSCTSENIETGMGHAIAVCLRKHGRNIVSKAGVAS